VVRNQKGMTHNYNTPICFNGPSQYYQGAFHVPSIQEHQALVDNWEKIGDVQYDQVSVFMSNIVKICRNCGLDDPASSDVTTPPR
jgi:hypothetical protein